MRSKDFKPLRCPRCNDKAIGAWELFVLFSPYMISGECRHCRQSIKINMKSIRYVALSLMVGFIVGNISKAVSLIDTPIMVTKAIITAGGNESEPTREYQ